MLTGSMKSALIAGKAAALATLMGTAAFAQVSVETPAGTDVTIPQSALEGQAPVATTPDTGYELLAQSANDDAITMSLEAQGFTSIAILRDGTVLTVTAERDGEPTELVYSTATGRLVSVDGIPVGPSESDFVVIDGATEGTAPATATGGVTDTGVGGAADSGIVNAPEPGVPGETDGGEPDPDATDGTDASDPDAAEGMDGTEAEGGAETDGQN
ncbi:MAG: hypothetical protein ACK4YU_06515 [Paracoccus sp. (in: a-proteobacteria)]